MNRFNRRIGGVVALAVGGVFASPTVPQVLAQVLAQGGVSLLAPPLDEAVKPANPLGGLPQGAQNMAQNFANGGGAPPAAQPAANAAPTEDVPFMTVKYIPAYALTVLAAGLGLFTACKFSGRRRDV
ncbi:MAG: hypothetical protein DWH79_06575 [Planctomycetota bacterium]|nr:MAG: hypothetical protein DWH79_06575 [Planctomycetota bacterium]